MLNNISGTMLKRKDVYHDMWEDARKRYLTTLSRKMPACGISLLSGRCQTAVSYFFKREDDRLRYIATISGILVITLSRKAVLTLLSQR